MLSDCVFDKIYNCFLQSWIFLLIIMIGVLLFLSTATQGSYHHVILILK
jgi:hypothetical protein